MSAPGLDWPLDEDGFPHREAARVVLFDEEGRILLARGHDRDEPDRHWWFTIGGGMITGESPREAAVRELWEETAIRVDALDLIGPVLHRSATFDFLRVTAKQDEWFFIGHTIVHATNDEGWTDLERDVIDEQRWWGLDDLAALAPHVELYPRGLADFARSWWSGWDGTMVRITETSGRRARVAR